MHWRVRALPWNIEWYEIKPTVLVRINILKICGTELHCLLLVHMAPSALAVNTLYHEENCRKRVFNFIPSGLLKTPEDLILFALGVF